MTLPKPIHKHGYVAEQLDVILAERGISREDFNRAFGINTCALDDELGVIVYPEDVERALWLLGHKEGVYHAWD